MSTTERNVDATARKRVLVIAHPDLAETIYEGLDGHIDPAARVTIASLQTPESGEYDVSWLCSNIFPSPLQTKRNPVAKALSALKSWWQNGPTTSPLSVPSTDSAMSLFRWGEYDFVIIQDLWPMRSTGGETLECAGWVLANLDYYLWGNFSTKKIILITDNDFLVQKAKWISQQSDAPYSTSRLQNVQSVFDQKQAFETIKLTEGDLAKCLRELISVKPLGGDGGNGGIKSTSTPVHSHRPAKETEKIFKILAHPVMCEVGKALQSYVRHEAEVLVVDDELADLNQTFEQLTGNPASTQPTDSADHVNVATASSETVERANTFDALVELCTTGFEKAASSKKRYTLLVTDILFRGPTWNKTGLDLIETLRSKAKQQQNAGRTGIVAYTAFTTPFIAMSSYQRGADFVVAKTVVGRHDPLVEGAQRLMMTLAFLCFQKSFLSGKRREAGEIIKKAGTSKPEQESHQILRSLRQLQAILPRYTVSLHLQQEWLDTCYLYEAMNIYGAASEQLNQVYDEVSRKYD